MEKDLNDAPPALVIEPDGAFVSWEWVYAHLDWALRCSGAVVGGERVKYHRTADGLLIERVAK